MAMKLGRITNQLRMIVTIVAHMFQTRREGQVPLSVMSEGGLGQGGL